MQCYDTDHVLKHVDSYASFTSDLGTEVKVCEFNYPRENLNLIMPHWLSRRVGRSPIDLRGEWDDDDDEDDGDRATPTYNNPLLQCTESMCFLRNAMPILSAGHTIHNAMKALPEALKHYKLFIEELETVEKALTHPGRRERICAKCLMGTPYAKYKDAIMGFSFTLHEDRWGAVASFCVASILPLAVLRRCWSQDEYEGKGASKLLEKKWAGDVAGKAFSASSLTALLKSPLFRHYHYMICKMKSIPSYLMQWFDNCPCHDELFSNAKTKAKRRQALHKDGLDCDACPNGSCRAWEVIDGKLDTILSALGEAIEADIVSTVGLKNNDGLTDPLSASDLVLILVDYRAGVAHIQLSLGIRLSWRKNLPWLLMAIPHPNPDRGVHWARKCVEAYAQKPEVQHHRLSVLFLKPGSPLRVCIDIFIATSTMPRPLRLQSAPFLFVPLGDRYIEREHKYLSDVTRPKTGVHLGHAFSVKRLKIVEGLLADSVFREKLVQHYMSLKTTKGLIKAMGFEHHPVFKELFQGEGSSRMQIANKETNKKNNDNNNIKQTHIRRRTAEACRRLDQIFDREGGVSPGFGYEIRELRNRQATCREARRQSQEGDRPEGGG